MLKINLSDEQDDTREETGGKTVLENAADTMAESTPAESDENEEKPKGRGSQRRTFILLALLALVVLVYFQRDTILGLLGGQEKEVEPVMAPPPPPSESEPEVVPGEPDPTFVVLNGISSAVPGKVWLSSLVVMYNGSFEIKGLGFTHDAVNAFIASLGNTGKITSQTVPKKSESSDAMYTFAVNGVFGNISVPEILDVITADRIVALAEEVKGRSEELGVSFSRTPQAGQTYTEKDLPFMLEGSYEGLKKVVAALCPEGGTVKIYRLVISPVAPGTTFDRIRASFSIRTVSSI